MHLIKQELAEELSGWCEASEIIIAYGKYDSDVEALCEVTRKQKIEARAIQVEKTNQPAVLVLGMKYVLDLKEATELIEFQPDNEVLLYMAIDYVSLRKAEQFKQRSVNLAGEYWAKEHPDVTVCDNDALDDDEEIVDKERRRNVMLFVKEEDQPIKIDLPY